MRKQLFSIFVTEIMTMPILFGLCYVLLCLRDTFLGEQSASLNQAMVLMFELTAVCLAMGIMKALKEARTV